MSVYCIKTIYGNYLCHKENQTELNTIVDDGTTNVAREKESAISGISSFNNCTHNVTWEVITTLEPRDFRKNETYIKVYIYWMNLFVNLLAPLVIMFILNVAVYRDLKKLWSNPVTYCTHARCIKVNQRQHSLVPSDHATSRRTSGVSRILLLTYNT